MTKIGMSQSRLNAGNINDKASSAPADAPMIKALYFLLFKDLPFDKSFPRERNHENPPRAEKI
jgi:hypothetical protein